MGPKTSAIESTLECVQITTKKRTLLYRENDHIEAPNWSPCGSYLIFNKHGSLYKLSLNPVELTGAISTEFNLAQTQLPLASATKINTDFADAINNDHGISPDGKLLVISHHAQEHDGESIIYTVPSNGGTPKKITPNGPSYWHGWSPDGSTLAFVAGRKEHDDYNIYTIASDGGEETQLTATTGLDDGPEYSADGKTLYFNSYRNGKMQIWQMDTDGAAQQQLVHSNHSDWFPHPSPDGSYLVFIRYLQDQQQAHPFGRDVQLMLLHIATQTLTELTTIFYGGQGTINVPSWSPDSQYVAFVRYTLL